jgi:hypothetical protein
LFEAPARIETCEGMPARLIDNITGGFKCGAQSKSFNFTRSKHQTGRPGYVPGALFKLHIYGELNRAGLRRRLK